MSEPLKPCPFCGSADVNLRRVRSGRLRVSCPCGADGPIYEKERAIDAWNTRAGMAEPPAGAVEPVTWITDLDPKGAHVTRTPTETTMYNEPPRSAEASEPIGPVLDLMDALKKALAPRPVEANVCSVNCGQQAPNGAPGYCSPECLAAGRPVRPAKGTP